MTTEDDKGICITQVLSTPTASMKSSKLWIDAISQNAWDTGAFVSPTTAHTCAVT